MPEGRKQAEKEAGEFDPLVRAIQRVTRTAWRVTLEN